MNPLLKEPWGWLSTAEFARIMGRSERWAQWTAREGLLADFGISTYYVGPRCWYPNIRKGKWFFKYSE